MASEQTMLKSTFIVALLCVVVNLVTAFANWRAHFDRAQMFAQMAQLEQRVVAPEAAGKELDMQQCRQQRCQ